MAAFGVAKKPRPRPGITFKATSPGPLFWGFRLLIWHQKCTQVPRTPQKPRATRNARGGPQKKQAWWFTVPLLPGGGSVPKTQRQLIHYHTGLF
jgi:hypothetical protein